MSYVRWSTKVIQDCSTCENEHFVPIVPERPDWLTFRPDPEKYGDILSDDHPSLPDCCTSCWYIYYDVNGRLAVWHSGCSGHPEGDTSLYLTVDEAEEWEPPQNCIHRQVAIDAVRAWMEDLKKERSVAAGA